jgi:hypothetical protein
MLVNTTRRRMLAALAAGLSAAGALSSCGSGQINQTGSQRAAVDGAPVNSKFVSLRNAVITLSGKGSFLSFVAVNTTIHNVKFSSVSITYPPSEKAENVGELANKEIPAQGRLQVGSAAEGSAPAAAEGNSPRIDKAPAIAVRSDSVELVPGRWVHVDFHVTAPAAPELNFPTEETDTFQADVPIVGSAETAAAQAAEH